MRTASVCTAVPALADGRGALRMAGGGRQGGAGRPARGAEDHGGARPGQQRGGAGADPAGARGRRSGPRLDGERACSRPHHSRQARVLRRLAAGVRTRVARRGHRCHGRRLPQRFSEEAARGEPYLLSLSLPTQTGRALHPPPLLLLRRCCRARPRATRRPPSSWRCAAVTRLLSTPACRRFLLPRATLISCTAQVETARASWSEGEQQRLRQLASSMGLAAARAEAVMTGRPQPEEPEEPFDPLAFV